MIMTAVLTLQVNGALIAVKLDLQAAVRSKTEITITKSIHPRARPRLAAYWHSIPSGHPIAGLYLPKARAWRRAPCRNPPSLRTSSAPLLDCSGRVRHAPDPPQSLRTAFPLWHSGPPAQCQLRRAPTVPRRASPSFAIRCDHAFELRQCPCSARK